MNKKDEEKKVAVLDGTSTRNLLDLNKTYIKNNPKKFISGNRKKSKDS